jgi:CheY-like chemotaxis protein
MPPARSPSGKPRLRTISPPPRSAPRKSPPAAPHVTSGGSAPERAAVPALASPALQGPPAVLIVDDDSAIRELLRRVIVRKGWRADTANDGGEGIQKIGAAPPPGYAVILLDLMMPNINGFEVIEHFKTHNASMLSRIVVVTASPKVDHARIYVELIAGLIEKPFDIDQLGNYLQPLVERTLI